MDFIGKIYPASSKGHSLILVATYIFTKWIEDVPLKKEEQGNVINFVKENIIHRFGIPESLTTNQRTILTGPDMRGFVEDYGIKLINLSPHYPQSNGKAEASNKVLIRILQKMMEENLRDWPRLLEAMIMELEDVEELRIQAYNAFLLQKQKVARIYNKRINKKSFQEGDVVWKTILPLGTKDRDLGKWSPNWEGPQDPGRVANWLSS
ncbi:uncharacterized protein LOC142519705 [Primulina tabacum]|uniref:uncharacterized protein LOC142519705 n=1 Tax=Primulina tabacum TaxID=48773 RepID=UPI003F59F044